MSNKLFSLSKDNLESFTYVTCVIGGAYWSSKYFGIKKSGAFKLTSVCAVLGVFYANYALSVNKFLIKCELVPVNILYRGYVIIFGAVIFDIAQDLYHIAHP